MSRRRGFLQRLSRHRAAMVALAVLALLASACLAGPLLTGHAPDRFYPDLRQLPAGLTAQPDDAHLKPALERIAFRMRASVVSAEHRGDTFISSSQRSTIDRRSLVYLPRSDLFGAAQVTAEEENGRRHPRHAGAAPPLPARDGHPRARSADAQPRRGPNLAGRRTDGDLRGSSHRRRLRGRRGLRRRRGGCRDDARGRCALRATLRVLRHPAAGVLPGEPLADAARHRRRGMARHGAHRAGADHVAARTRFRPRGAGPRPVAAAILVRHVVPNTLGPVAVAATLLVRG